LRTVKSSSILCDCCCPDLLTELDPEI
jgi:hypothetical protein